MTYSIPTLADSLWETVPGMAIGLTFFIGWFFITKVIMRRADREYDDKLKSLSVKRDACKSGMDITGHNQSLAYAYEDRRLAGRGRPSERIFLFGIMSFGVIALFFAGWFGFIR